MAYGVLVLESFGKGLYPSGVMGGFYCNLERSISWMKVIAEANIGNIFDGALVSKPQA